MIRYLTIGLLLLGLNTFAQSKVSYVEYEIEDGLLIDQALDVVHDKFGFIWLSHGNHLTRFDGYEFKIYTHVPKDSLMQLDAIGELWDNSDGTMWITNLNNQDTAKRTLLKYDKELDGFIRYKPKLKNQPKGIGYFEQDKEQRIWMGSREGGGLYEFNPATGKTLQHIHVHSDSLTQLVNKVTGITDRDSCLYLTTFKGLWKFDKSTGAFSRPHINPKDTSTLFTQFIHKFYSKNWIRSGTDGLWVKIDSAFTIVDEFKEPPEIHHAINSYRIDRDDVFTFRTATGFYRFNYKTNALQLIPEANPLEGGTRSLVWGWTVDGDGNLWIVGGAIRKIVPREFAYHVSNINGYSGGPARLNMITKTDRTDHGVIVLNNDSGNKIWTGPVQLASSEFKLAYHNEHNKFERWGEPDYVTRFQLNKWADLNSRRNGVFMNPCVGKNYLWIAAQLRGVVGIPYDKNTGELFEKNIRLLYHDQRNPNTIPGISMYNVFEDLNDHLWVGNAIEEPTLINLEQKYGSEGSIQTISHDPSDSTSISSGYLHSVIQKNENSVWVATSGGLNVFKNGKFERVYKDSLDTYLPYLSPTGRLYITTGTGIYTAVASDGYKKFTKVSNALPWSNLFEDSAERLWMVTDKGLEVFDPGQQVTVHIWSKKEREIFSMQQTHDGKILALVVAGSLLTFDPTEFKISQKRIIPVLTKLFVNHKLVRAHEANDFSLSTDISVLEELVISHQHNNFSLEFSALEMNSPKNNLYRYKLEGYDKDWIETDYRNRRANYSNLPAGSYIFRVKASNHHGVWSDEERKLTIEILPPSWKSTWAYIGYAFIFIGLLYAARRNIVQRERLKSNLKLAEVEREKEHFELEKAKEVDKIKSTFFANISHEFRTPLTLIKGPVQEVMEELSDHPKIRERLKLAEKNADHVLRLINQLLDLAKLESGTLKVEKSTNDFNSFVSAIVYSFSSLAFQKNITLSTELPPVRYLARFDRDKVETVLINLVNNAVKFTQSGGKVHVSASFDMSTSVTLAVRDTGIGIPEDQHRKVFERFHQVSEVHGEIGTGIGLSLVKELVSLMNGTIALNSTLGKGSQFTITLPVEQLREVTGIETTPVTDKVFQPDAIDTHENGVDQEHNQRPHVLVVEDNTDLRKFIIDSLGKEFHFLEAADGKHGLQIAIAETPDLIISDVMMPEMDGITMTGILKKDSRTSHIPLILLTAKTSDESRLSGLETGADDYLTKPFNKNELLLKVRNSIALRVKLREKLKLELLKESPNVEVQSADEKFLLKVREAILSRLSDEQLSVESLADEIGLSRSQLFRKISALTGASVNELIRTFRLQKAAQLLEQNWAPVTQVAYEVGYSNLSYFSKAFKEKYGVSPSEYPVRTN